ncbi:sodium-dependent transporter [bacterium]|nr:sodium-dependent transporter [bacterium]
MAISPSQLPEREGWSTKLGVILAVAGSAVGLGNFLRFPGVAAQNGGGAFMVPYFVAFLLLGIPICWSEWIMGRYGGRRSGLSSCPGILGYLCRGGVMRYFGALGLFIPVVIYMYYVYIESWCLAYAWFTVSGQLGRAEVNFAEFFNQYTGLGSGGGEYFGSVVAAFLFFLVTFFINFALIYRGLSKGIEKFCIWAMPVLVLCALFIVARVLTLGAPNPALPDQNVNNGLGFMWNPKWGALADADVWLAACGQIFFSLSIGFGIIMTYASYLKKKDDVVLSGLTASTMNEFCEVCLGGLIVLPAAFIFLGMAGTAEAAKSTFGLGFVTMPHIFALMPLGRIFGFLFYTLLFLAGVTSSLSMLQPAIAFLEEGFNLGRRASVTFLALITFMGSCALIFSHGSDVLGTMDNYASNLGIPLLALAQVVIFVFVIGVDRGVREGRLGADMRLPRWFPFVITYVSPLFLCGILGSWFYQNFLSPSRVEEELSVLELNTILGMLGLLALFFVLVHLAWPRMRQRAMLYARQNPEEAQE